MSPMRRFRKTGIDSMWGHYVFDQVVSQDHFIRALRNLFDWDALADGLIDLYEGKGEEGAPPYNPSIMLRLLFLGYLYGVSDRGLERLVNDSISARFFLGIAVNELAPDHSCISDFTARLAGAERQGLVQSIFDRMLQQAMAHGLEFGGIQLLDAVHTEADVNAEKEKTRVKQGKARRDPSARLVHKGKHKVVKPNGTTIEEEVTYTGYKTHASMDAKTRVITSLLPSWGNSADNKAFPDLFAHDLELGLPTHTYGGDKAYDDTDIFERIEQHGMHVGIKLRRTRTQKKDPNKERWIALKQTRHYQTAIRVRSRVEQPFGQAKDKHGFGRCRYLGLAKYRIQAFMTFMVVNAKRIVKLLTGITFRELAKGVRKEVYKPVYATPPWV